MNNSFRKYSAFLLLAIYVPVALVINLKREHHPLYIHHSNGHHLVITKFDPHSLNKPDDCLCQACQFVQGHISPVKFSISIYLKGFKIITSDKAFSLSYEGKNLPQKRAPPIRIAILS